MPSSSTRRRVKIVCTLGPASRSPERIASLIREGMDVVRLNFSHGSHADHAETIERVREAARKAKKPVCILQDLQGPKLRVGKLPGGRIELNRGDEVILYPEGSEPKKVGPGQRLLPISREIAVAIAKDVRKDARILFNDGAIISRVLSASPPEILVQIEVGGPLTDHKGINLPGTPLSLPCLTEKDIKDLEFGLAQGVDAVALSFVRTAKDIEGLRKRIAKHGKIAPLVVAKIEREEGVENLDEILAKVDGMLIARGDMAVELGVERVPVIQKQIIRACNARGIPVITATQMLESMIASPTPTRAEATDVANAVFDGTDAVMLSAETASGQYPVESVATMTRIIMEAERSVDERDFHRTEHDIPGSVVDAIESSAATIAAQVGAVCIACLTHSGLAARTLAKFRPRAPIVAIMDNEAMLRRLALVWGVRGVVIPKIVGTDDLFQRVESVLKANEWADMEDLVVVTAGIPTLRRGTTNMVKVHRVGAKTDRSLPPTP